MSPLEEQRLLHRVGFPIVLDGNFGPQSRQARRDFKRGAPRWCRKSRRLYERRLTWSARNGGKVSEHFYYREWKSNGNGWIKVDRMLVKALEKLREVIGPIGILSGYRDPAYNFRIGGSKYSIHMFGGAIDPTVMLPTSKVLSIKRFSGVGTNASASGPTRHVDVRGQGSVPNYTGGTRTSPTRWIY